MTEHTPGSWSIGYGHADYLVVEAGINEEIAAIELEEHGAEPTPEQLANANLLAAAPDLLAACEAVAAAMALEDYLSPEEGAATRLCHIAIAKAKGD